MNETKRDLLGLLAMRNQLGCVKCALDMGREIPLTFYRAFCEGCRKNQEPSRLTDGLRAFRAMDTLEQEEHLAVLRKRVLSLADQYEASLRVYGEEVQERMNLACLSNLLDEVMGGGSAETPPKGRRGSGL